MADINQKSKSIRLLAIDNVVGMHRWDVYGHVLGRVNASIEAGFYIEAVTLMESFISDRLESYMLAHDVPYSSKDSFYKCIQQLTNSETDFDRDLLKKLDEWRKKRNTAVHRMAKFNSLEEADWANKMKCIEEAAKMGRELLGPVKQATAHK